MNVIFSVVLFGLLRFTLGSEECEVCVSFLQRFQDAAGDKVYDVEKSEAELMKFCKTARGKDESFCYYIGASETSATRIITSVTKPLSYSKPVEKICKDLGKKDAQICELKYEKQIDWNEIDLKKLRVKELKKILMDWGEHCRGCVEKRDFIEKIDQIKGAHIEL